MKRDLNLVKLVLEKMEDKQDFGQIDDKDFYIDNYDQQLVEYHLVILFLVRSEICTENTVMN